MESNRKKFLVIYIVGLLISLFLMIWILFWGELSLYGTLLIFFISIKFLSGFGLILSISKGTIFILEKLSEKLKRKQKTSRNITIFTSIFPFILIGYAFYLVISSAIGGGSLSQTGIMAWIENILFLYGILSLLISLYIKPIIIEEFDKAAELGKLTWWKKRFKKTGRSLKKKYFQLRKDFALAQVQDQMEINEVLDLWHRKFALNMLLILSIGSLIFTPVLFICIMYWVRIYILFRNEPARYEKIMLLVAIIFIGVFAILIPFWDIFNPFYQLISNYYWIVNLGYLIGIITGTFIFTKKLLNIHGITLISIKMKRKDRKIEKLKGEKEELEMLLKEKSKPP